MSATTPVVETDKARAREDRQPIHLASQASEDYARVLGSAVQAYCGVWCQLPEQGLPNLKSYGTKAKVCRVCDELSGKDES
jgi:hypothetical protein